LDKRLFQTSEEQKVFSVNATKANRKITRFVFDRVSIIFAGLTKKAT